MMMVTMYGIKTPFFVDSVCALITTINVFAVL